MYGFVLVLGKNPIYFQILDYSAVPFLVKIHFVTLIVSFELKQIQPTLPCHAPPNGPCLRSCASHGDSEANFDDTSSGFFLFV